MLIREYECVGSINLTDKTDATDPCYDRSTWCRKNDINTIPGKYNCYAARYRLDDCIAACIIVHEGYKMPDRYEWDEIDTIGVDSGMAGFFNNKPDFKDFMKEYCNTVFAMDKERDSDDPEADTYIIPTQNGDSFATRSGWGDGGYPLSGVRERGGSGSYYALQIEFILDGDLLEDGEEPEDYE